MTKCRMCSQQLTRPGRLCRECEREIDRERAAVEGFAAVVALPGSSGLAAEGATSRTLRSRTVALSAAFVVGIGIAASAYIVQGARSAHGAGTSVMIDRDLSSITPRDIHSPVQARRTEPPAAVAGAHPAAPSYDRVLGLADALDRCTDAAPPARPACLARARAEYCGSAGADRIPQCITPR
jgi:hypothetical protein